ncbi:MAG: hypothetical protein OEM02_02315 [Desulfobulbaceae bacterium]|nr:hypothetical protein [Desulfobulbaceae bacterium]
MYHETISHHDKSSTIPPSIFEHEKCLVIGQTLNVLNPFFQKALEENNKSILIDLARRQLAVGARGLNINPGPAESMDRKLPWVTATLGSTVDVDMFLPAHSAYLAECLALFPRRVVINGITVDDQVILREKMALARRYEAGLVVMLLRSGGNGSLEEKLKLAVEVMEMADEMGVDYDRLYLDPVITSGSDPMLHALRRGRPPLDSLVDSIQLLDALSGEKIKVIMELSNILGGEESFAQCQSFQNSIPALLADAGLDALVMDCCYASQSLH